MQCRIKVDLARCKWIVIVLLTDLIGGKTLLECFNVYRKQKSSLQCL